MRSLIGLRLWLALSFSLLLGGCGRPPLQQQESFVFGTRVEVLVADESPEKGRQAIAAVLREFDRLHRAYHAWEPSELSRLNVALAAGQSAEVSPELAALIRQAQEITARGDGLFDPGIGRLIGLWGFQSDEFKPQLPDPAALAAWRAARPGIADLQLDGLSASSRKRALALDFGGYLKGVALDRAAAMLKAAGIRNALINLGGNILVLGDKYGSKWKVGIQHPRQPGPLATIELADGEAIGTSGDYQRYFELDGQRYCHLLDPRSGSPVADTAAVTVLINAAAGAEAGTRSDAYSKPIFVAGAAGWRQMADKMGVGEVLRVGRDGRIQVTAALAARLQFIGDKPDIEVLP
ncbi:MAG: hypothetical protein RIR00_2120 [Pseudomonadota bacterium]|jgi:thiamine biosynthesis lipoprotein